MCVKSPLFIRACSKFEWIKQIKVKVRPRPHDLVEFHYLAILLRLARYRLANEQVACLFDLFCSVAVDGIHIDQIGSQGISAPLSNFVVGQWIATAATAVFGMNVRIVPTRARIGLADDPIPNTKAAFVSTAWFALNSLVQ